MKTLLKIESGCNMSHLLILGNINKYTFCNAIVAAQEKSQACLQQEIEDIYVVHTKESFEALFENMEKDWLNNLKRYSITESMFINRVIDANNRHSDTLLNYIKNIIQITGTDSLIIDVTNGTSELKTLLSIIVYLLDVHHAYFIDSAALSQKYPNNMHSFFDDKKLKPYYRKVTESKIIDRLGYLNLTEIIRYKDKIADMSEELYSNFGEEASDSSFFADNLCNAVELFLKNKNAQDQSNSLYRIAATAIAASLEEVMDKILYDCDIKVGPKATLGKKMNVLKERLANSSSGFDYNFLSEINKFILYLRNNTTHKAFDITETQKYKASLLMNIAFVFVDYYSQIVYKELKVSGIRKNNHQDEYNFSLLSGPVDYKTQFFGLDGDKTGGQLEKLLLNNSSEDEIKEFSGKIAEAVKEIVKYIKSKPGSEVVFARGDDILFKGSFTREELEYMKMLYEEKTGGETCSIAYGSSVREVLLAMKMAKIQRNSIRGIFLSD